MNHLPIPPRRLTDPAFVYVPAAHTNLRATFERIKAQQEQQQGERRQ